jgi:hypothetical protein
LLMIDGCESLFNTDVLTRLVLLAVI